MTFTGQLGTTQSQLANIQLGAMSTVVIAVELAGRFVVMVGFRERYIGPGSGLVVGGVTREQMIAMLREGDTFQAILPWAGVRGRSGLTRVLDRMRDDTGRPTFRGQFIPTTDPSLMQSQVQRPRLTVDTRTNLVRRVRDAEQQVNKLESTD